MTQPDPTGTAGNPAPLNMEGPICGATASLGFAAMPLNVLCTSLAGHVQSGQRWHTDGAYWWYQMAGSGKLRSGLVSEGTPLMVAGDVPAEALDSTTLADGGFRVVGPRPFVPPKPGILATAVELARAELSELAALVGTERERDPAEMSAVLLAISVKLQLADLVWKIARGRDVPAS